jgi:hypothetical protein
VIELTPWEFKSCVDLANIRMAVSNDRQMNNSSTYERDYLKRIREEIVGACGEQAFAKMHGLYWPPSVNTFHVVPDVGEVEVRATEVPTGRLIVRDNDPEDRWYYLMIGDFRKGAWPQFRLAGCMKGAAAKQDQWLDNPNGYRESWFVPQDALIPSKAQCST